MKVRAWFAHQWVLLFVFVGCLFFGPVQNSMSYLYETRTYRDVTLSTPFYRVDVLSREISEDGRSVTLRGTFVKRRCTFVGLSAYIYDPDGLGHLVEVNTHVENAIRPRGNRPPSDKAQVWGPWTVTNEEVASPVSYEIWAQHVCPESKYPQDNLFLSGKW